MLATSKFSASISRFRSTASQSRAGPRSSAGRYGCPDESAARSRNSRRATAPTRRSGIAPEAAQTPPVAQSAPDMVAQTPAARPPDPQQLEAIARDLAAVRPSIDRLAAGQEQMARNIAKVQAARSEEHTSELQSRVELVCRLLLEK